MLIAFLSSSRSWELLRSIFFDFSREDFDLLDDVDVLPLVLVFHNVVLKQQRQPEGRDGVTRRCALAQRRPNDVTAKVGKRNNATCKNCLF